MQVSLGKSVGMGLLRAPVVPKTGISRFGDHSGALPVERGRKLYFLPQQSPSIVNRNTRIDKKRWKLSDPRPTPKLATSAIAAAHNSPFCAALRLAPQSTKSQQKNRTCTAGFEPVTANVRIY